MKKEYLSIKNKRLLAFLVLLSTSSASEFNKAYKTITGERGASIVYYLQKLGEEIK